MIGDISHFPYRLEATKRYRVRAYPGPANEVPTVSVPISARNASEALAKAKGRFRELTRRSYHWTVAHEV